MVSLPSESDAPSKEISLDSEDFDPNAALFGGENVKVNIPVPEARVFNNLAEYYSRTFAKKNERKAEENLTKQVNAASASTSRFANFQLKPTEDTRGTRRSKGKSTTSVLDKMQQTQGPLSILYRSISQPIRILVRRRKTCPLRDERFAWISGLLVAFDKHLNLALQNVYEEYLHQRTGSKEGIRIRKYTKQLLVRGDNIVLVSNSLTSS